MSDGLLISHNEAIIPSHREIGKSIVPETQKSGLPEDQHQEPIFPPSQIEMISDTSIKLTPEQLRTKMVTLPENEKKYLSWLSSLLNPEQRIQWDGVSAEELALLLLQEIPSENLPTKQLVTHFVFLHDLFMVFPNMDQNNKLEFITAFSKKIILNQEDINSLGLIEPEIDSKKFGLTRDEFILFLVNLPIEKMADRKTFFKTLIIKGWLNETDHFYLENLFKHINKEDQKLILQHKKLSFRLKTALMADFKTPLRPKTTADYSHIPTFFNEKDTLRVKNLLTAISNFNAYSKHPAKDLIKFLNQISNEDFELLLQCDFLKHLPQNSYDLWLNVFQRILSSSLQVNKTTYSYLIIIIDNLMKLGSNRKIKAILKKISLSERGIDELAVKIIRNKFLTTVISSEEKRTVKPNALKSLKANFTCIERFETLKRTYDTAREKTIINIAERQILDSSLTFEKFRLLFNSVSRKSELLKRYDLAIIEVGIDMFDSQVQLIKLVREILANIKLNIAQKRFLEMYLDKLIRNLKSIDLEEETQLTETGLQTLKDIVGFSKELNNKKAMEEFILLLKKYNLLTLKMLEYLVTEITKDQDTVIFDEGEINGFIDNKDYFKYLLISEKNRTGEYFELKKQSWSELLTTLGFSVEERNQIYFLLFLWNNLAVISINEFTEDFADVILSGKSDLFQQIRLLLYKNVTAGREQDERILKTKEHDIYTDFILAGQQSFGYMRSGYESKIIGDMRRRNYQIKVDGRVISAAFYKFDKKDFYLLYSQLADLFHEEKLPEADFDITKVQGKTLMVLWYLTQEKLESFIGFDVIRFYLLGLLANFSVTNEDRNQLHLDMSIDTNTKKMKVTVLRKAEIGTNFEPIVNFLNRVEFEVDLENKKVIGMKKGIEDISWQTGDEKIRTSLSSMIEEVQFSK